MEEPPVPELINDVVEVEESLADEMTASDVIERNLREYAKENTLGQCCHMIDGLKQIHRRIIWTIKTEDDSSMVSEIAGKVMGLYHPHGDASITNAIVRLMQPFNNVIPLVCSDRNVGSYSGEPAAAGRYLPGWSSEFAKDLFYTNVNLKTLKYQRAENFKAYEPSYLIPRIPTSLLVGSFGLIMGYRSDIPILDLTSLCDLAIKYIEQQKDNITNRPTDLLKYPELFIPEFTTNSLIRNRRVLAKAYRERRFDIPVLTDGVMEVYPTIIIIKTVSPTVAVDKIFSNTCTQLGVKDSFIQRNFTKVDNLSVGKMEAHLEFSLKRNVDPFSVIDQLKRSCGFSRGWTPSMLFTDMNGNLRKLDHLQLLEAWYQERHQSIRSDLCITQKELVLEFRKISALIIIADHTDTVVNIFKNSKNKSETIQPLCEKFKLTQFQAAHLASLSLGQLTQYGRDELVAKAKHIEEQCHGLLHKFQTINETMVHDCTEIKNKYGKKTPRRSRFPNFIGRVRLANGVIQFSDYDEMHKLLSHWDDYVDIQLYGSSGNMYILNNNTISPCGDVDPPKELKCSNLLRLRKLPKWVIVYKPGYLYRLDPNMYDSSPEAINALADDQVVMVDEFGKLTLQACTSIPKRAKPNALGIMTEVIHVFNPPSDEYVVFHGHHSDKGVIRANLVKGEGSLNNIPLKGWKVYGVADATKPYLLNIPPCIQNRKKTPVVLIPEPLKMFNTGRYTTIRLNGGGEGVQIKRNGCIHTV